MWIKHEAVLPLNNKLLKHKIGNRKARVKKGENMTNTPNLARPRGHFLCDLNLKVKVTDVDA